MLRGTHGTSASRAKLILDAGKFNASTQGRVGPGVYFWAYEESRFVAEEFARLWWVFASHKKEYTGDTDPSCAVLRTEIAKPEDEYLDLTELSLREQMLEWYCKHGCTRHDVAKMSALFVDTIEKQAQKKFAVLKAEVPSPPTVKGSKATPLTDLAKLAAVYVVRHERHELIAEIELIE